MTKQEEPIRRRAHPLRWLVAGLVAALIFLYVAMEMLPRMVGGLLGRGDALPGGEWGDAWDEPLIVWDPGPPDTPPAEETPAPPVPEREASPPIEEAETGEAAPAITAAADAGREAGGSPAAAGEPGPADEAGRLASAGSGQAAGEGRRSPRVLFQEWPREDVLAGLERPLRYRFRIRVEADGSVSDWELVGAGGACPPCLAEAERIVASLRFVPGTLHGRPVACWVPYEIAFHAGETP
ncbi:MAG: hypothetical protein JW819_11855 [Candidatus Krumholzibacteriota bacterium]|nr:hypothetical protein [Candidatus Krumholzibacteriota bacterium]